MRYALLFILLFPISVFAQGNETTAPQITVEAPEEPVIVGQPAIVRIKVLVPTFMPQPPEFPSLEQQNLLVRLPERASGPVSETVNGETWSGVQRSYRVYPLIAGDITFDAQTVAVTYADPATNTPVQATVDLPPVKITAEIPGGAEGLDPLIIATGFTLEQKLEGPTDMGAGDAITRELTARISGTTPLLIPVLTPQQQSPLLRAYPKEPRISETEDRGVLSGQRQEEVVYIAQQEGDAQLPEVSIDWFNLQTNQIETASVPATVLTLAPPKWQPPSLDEVLKIAAFAAIALIAIGALWRFLYPRIRDLREARRSRYLVSRRYAVDALKIAIQAHDLNATYAALELWTSRGGNPNNTEKLEDCLTRIGAARYSGRDQSEDWRSALQSLRLLQDTAARDKAALPPLNP